MNKSGKLKVRRDHRQGTDEITGEVYQGIIPSPSMMKEYKEVDPDLPMRLVKAMEDEAAHRRKVDTTIINYNYRTNRNNIVYGFLALIALGVLAYLFMINGHPNQGVGIAGSIGTVIGVFVLRKGRPEKKKEKSDL
jgi:uncharacterized membrane protein